MPNIIETKVGVGSNAETVTTTQYQNDETATLEDLVKERSRLIFKLESSGHQPANVTVRIAELDDLISKRAAEAL